MTTTAAQGTGCDVIQFPYPLLLSKRPDVSIFRLIFEGLGDSFCPKMNHSLGNEIFGDFIGNNFLGKNGVTLVLLFFFERVLSVGIRGPMLGIVAVNVFTFTLSAVSPPTVDNRATWN